MTLINNHDLLSNLIGDSKLDKNESRNKNAERKVGMIEELFYQRLWLLLPDLELKNEVKRLQSLLFERLMQKYLHNQQVANISWIVEIYLFLNSHVFNRYHLMRR